MCQNEAIACSQGWFPLDLDRHFSGPAQAEWDLVHSLKAHEHTVHLRHKLETALEGLDLNV